MMAGRSHGMPTTPKRVLVIDDEVKFCVLLKTFLEGRGHTVAIASTMNDALVQIEMFRPEVIVLDLVMPGISGLELLKLARERAFPPRVIIVTATDTEETTQQAMRDGAEAYMCKPIDLETLDRLICRIWPSQK